MAENPDPQNVGYGIAGAFALLAAIYGAIKGIVNRSAPRDEKNEEFQRQVMSDISRIEDALAHMKRSLERALDHSDKLHEGMFLRLGSMETSIAVLKTEIKHLQNGKKK